MTRRRTLAFGFLFLAFIAAFSLTPSYSARADECDIAYSAYKRKHPTLDPKEVIKQMNENLFGPDLKARVETMRRLTDEERQASQCEIARKVLSEQRDRMKDQRRVVAACGSRFRSTCDDACLAMQIEEDKQRADHECDPARIEEIRQRERNLKSSAANFEMCIERFNDPVEENLEDPDWPAWIKACNGAGQDRCAHIRLMLEDRGLSTRGLTCVPTEKDKEAFRKYMEDFPRKVDSDPGRFDDACFQMLATLSGIADDKLPRYITDCSRHPKKMFA
jgi:hypothetical protein